MRGGGGPGAKKKHRDAAVAAVPLRGATVLRAPTIGQDAAATALLVARATLPPPALRAAAAPAATLASARTGMPPPVVTTGKGGDIATATALTRMGGGRVIGQTTVGLASAAAATRQSRFRVRQHVTVKARTMTAVTNAHVYVGVQGTNGSVSATVAVGTTAAPTPGVSGGGDTGEYYAATDGSATGAGTVGDPWTLTVALAGGYPTNTVDPGDTVWIRGGTYTGSFSPTRAGSAGNPITYRAYPGERATIDCNGGSGINGYIFSFGAPYVRIQDMEIIDSDWIDNWAPAGIGGDPVSSGAPHLGCEAINCIIHDTGSSGLDTYSDALNGFLAYGNVVYFVGGTMGVNGQAYCVYGNNAAAHETKLFENNAFLYQWGTYPMHIYTQAGEIQHFTFKKNATLVAGDLKGDGRNWNFFGSGSKTLTDFLLDENCIFGNAFTGDMTDQGLFDFGVDGISSPYGALNGVTVTNNYLGGGTMAISTNRSNFSMSSNTMWGSAYFGWTYGAGGTFPSNTFHSSRPASNWTKVYPNDYEDGRAMLVCFNWASASSQDFDFSSFLDSGDTYEVRDAFNFYGTPVATGTYSGASVSVPLDSNPTIATTLKVPTGYSQPQHPAPDYYVFIVRKTGVAFVGSGTVQAGDFFVAPDVPYDTGSGTLADPWNLRHAFQFGGSALRGHTVWMRGGTYSPKGDGSGLDSYWVAFTGTAESPIVCRSYPGEWAKINGTPTSTGIGTPVLILQGNYFTLQEFEIYQEQAGVDRITTTPGPAPSDILFGSAIYVYQPSGPYYGQKLVNLVIHDTSQGISHWAESTDAEIYGCIVYYNGWEGPDDGHGHGIYSDNWDSPAGFKKVYENISFRQFGECAQAYNESGETQTAYDWKGNVLFAAGLSTVWPGQRLFMLGGDGTPAADSTNEFQSNLLWSNSGSGSDFLLGYYTHPWDTPNVHDNYLPRVGVSWIDGGTSGANIVNNVLTHTEGDDFDIGTQNTFRSEPLTGIDVFVRPNAYETGRANITIFNWDHASTVSVDISSVFTVGWDYVVYNAQDIFGNPVAWGTYSGTEITLPMTAAGGLTQAAPLGYATPDVTWPEFNVFVLRKV